MASGGRPGVSNSNGAPGAGGGTSGATSSPAAGGGTESVQITKQQQQQALERCYGAWDRDTHMSKSSFKAACRRTLSEDPGMVANRGQ
jgi:hypothetical protein